MFIEITLMLCVAAFFGAMVGNRFTRKSKKNLSIVAAGNLLCAQKCLYLLNALEDAQKRLQDLDKKPAPDQQKLTDDMMVTVKAIELIASE